ncbi:MAG: OmpA/MotB family protein [Planctomycetota bacterium]|jgi:flagellar motor protein MotB
MLVNAYARAGLVLVVAVLVAGCRTNTDRIRVLEAEKADAERRNSDLKHAQAELRAEKIKAEGEAESQRARLEALEAQLEIARTPTEAEGQESPNPARIDVARLSEELGRGAEVVERDDGGATIVLASDVTFTAGRADLNRQAQETLRRVARTLKQTDGFNRLRIEGHTDSDPIRKSGWRDNRELSLARASKVRMFLVAQGLGEDLMSVEGHGAARPIASNTSSQGKARNRRVEIVLVTPSD